MPNRITISLLAATCLNANIALADKNYFGGSVSFVDYSETGIGDDASLTMLTGRLGTKFNENFSGEMRIGLGVADDTVNILGTDVEVELDNMFGAYVRGGLQAADSFYPYVALGYTRGELSASVPGFSISESESDISFGFGADVDINKKLTLNIEYMNYYDKDGAELDGFGLGLVAKF